MCGGWGRVGMKTLGLYLSTTAIAITLAVVAVVLLRPGAGANLEPEMAYSPKEAPPLIDTLVGLFPSNPIQAHG